MSAQLELSHYGASKMGVVGLTKCLAHEGSAHNILVNAVALSGASRLADAVGARTSTRARSALGDEGYNVLRVDATAPMVAWLAHEDCTVSGVQFSTLMGRMARVFIGVTTGYHAAQMLSEDVRKHFEQIMDERRFSVPATSSDEFSSILARSNTDAHHCPTRLTLATMIG